MRFYRQRPRLILGFISMLILLEALASIFLRLLPALLLRLLPARHSLYSFSFHSFTLQADLLHFSACYGS